MNNNTIAISFNPGKSFYNCSLSGIEKIVSKWKGQTWINNSKLYYIDAHYRLHVSDRGAIKAFCYANESLKGLEEMQREVFNRATEIIAVYDENICFNDINIYWNVEKTTDTQQIKEILLSIYGAYISFNAEILEDGGSVTSVRTHIIDRQNMN